VVEAEGLEGAVRHAFEFDDKLVIEAGLAGPRELECAVLGGEPPFASVPGEIVVAHADGFYSYAAMYLDAEGASTSIPARLGPAAMREVERLALATFEVLEAEGLARVDLFLGADERLWVNEINTLPGFTAISMYPKMWEASGLSYPDLIDRLLTLAIERHQRKQQLRTSRT
jgi:D-alanine-D-alanine ligase